MHRPEKCTKPREYLFGTSNSSSAKVKKQENEDRFKTITLKDVRRSFREKYLINENAEEQKHQPLWFIDVKGNGDYMRSGPNIADRRSQTRSVHDSPSIERDTIDRSRSNSYSSNVSGSKQKSSLEIKSPLAPYGQPEQGSMIRSSSINVINNNNYATYKKKDPRFTLAEHERDAWKSSPNISIPSQIVNTFETNSQDSCNYRPSITSKEQIYEISQPSNNPYSSVEQKPAVTVSRKNTFKVVRNEEFQDLPKPGSTSLKRRDTFVVDIPPVSENNTMNRGYFLNRYRRLIEPEPEPQAIDRHKKFIPIGVAMPYNHQDDEPQPTSISERRRLFALSHKSMNEEPNVRDESPPLYASTTYFHPDKERQKSPQRRKTPEPRSPTTSPPKKPFRNRPTIIQINETLKKPVESMKISFESLRKPASPKRDPNQTNLGFDRFYDPNYYVPKNQNLFGPLASAQLRTVNVSVQPKIGDRSSWLYSQNPK